MSPWENTLPPAMPREKRPGRKRAAAYGQSLDFASSDALNSREKRRFSRLSPETGQNAESKKYGVSVG